ncbi:uncharacterized protein [Populus alba]|uniref:uncharacterized protein n=1 Tax=Populus alba TaxID=43335 RepID=UPI003CC72DFC
MAESNKFKTVNENCKKLETQLQNHHLEWQESMAESKERWLEQGTRIDQLVLQMEIMSSQFQQFIASQPARKDIGTSSRGILATPGTDKETGMPVSAEKNAPGYRNQFRSEQMMGQELHREESNNALSRRSRPVQHSNITFNNGRVMSNTPSPAFNPNRMEGGRPKPDSLFEQRKRLGQCFKCGDKYTSGHRCNTKGLHMIEGVEEEDDKEVKEFNDTLQEECTERRPIDEFGLSLNALAKNDTYNTIRIKGNCQGRDLIFLIDNGSTHSFIDETTITELNVSKSKTTLLAVTVANGNVMLCEMQSPGFTWFMQGYEFKANLRLRLSFKKSDRIIELKGIVQSSDLHMISAIKEKNSFKDVIVEVIGQFFAMDVEEDKPTKLTVEIESLLKEFAGLFEEPRTLPLARKFDHKILLKSGSQAVNIRPYKSSFIQKGEIEKLVKEMLANGVIQQSTIKNKFPIPFIDDILDELHGSRFFSKLDLRSGYHQVRMHEEDIEKTTFRTHHGHYEFRVMPFGLTNAPTTFQALMNSVLEPFLQKFVLVFFNDILIYSSTFELHLAHLRHFGIISKPLIDLLKKNNYGWSMQAQQAFTVLKQALCKAPFLALPDFSKTFMLETDASDYGLRAVLSQKGKPVAYFSKSLSSKHLGLSIYKKEYLAILMALEKWRHYLEQEQFIIQIYHESLKYLLDQKIHTTIQKKGLTKLLGLRYKIVYRKGRENIVADALSRKINDLSAKDIGTLKAITNILPAWYEEVYASYKKDCRGHAGIQNTYRRLKSNFHWYGMKVMVKETVEECDVCRQAKVERVAYPGLLQPLPAPEGTWEAITMDFIEGLPSSKGRNAILVVVDSHHSAVGISPFQVLYGYTPPQREWLAQDPTSVAAVEEVLQRRANMDHTLKRHLETISKRIGMVAYELKLPEGSLIHPVFHVSLLKKKVGDATIVSSKLPVSDKEGRMRIMPLAILDRKLMKKGNRASTAVLVQWSNLYLEDATWEDLSDLQK